MFKLKMLAVVAAAVVMAGCGGGSDTPDNPVGAPLPITSANYLEVTQEVLTATVGLVGVSETLLGTQVEALPSPVSFARGRLPGLWLEATDLPLIAGVVYEETFACPGGGTLVETIDDRDNDGFLSSGDVVRETYNSCVIDTERLDGAIRYSFTSLVGDFSGDVFSAQIGLSFLSFRITSLVTVASALANGDLTLTTNSFGVDNFDTQLNTASYREEVSIGGQTISRTATNFQTREVRVPTMAGFDTTVTASGTLTSSLLGGNSVGIGTVAPLVRSSPSEYPASGVLQAIGAAGSLVRIEALSDTQFQLLLDANGDGFADPPTPVTLFWSDFI
ncbi:MAG: hypothetical protein EP306_03070 [Burkholderiales bacterium]|nr:MAG: hypothetical protein EP306_03070 [Burkholderiales bacterium]